MAGKNIFNSVKLYKPRTNVFDLSHDVKLSLDMGKLVPVMVTECVPGDKFNISGQALVRFAPMVAPVMHRFDVSIHYFFVPHRLTWENWEAFVTNNESPAPAMPFLRISNSNYNKLADYLGLPNPAQNNYSDFALVNALPFAAYQMIYNEYYRDQNLIDPVNFKLVNGDNNANTELRELRIRAWEHDYFTASLPFAQKGAAVDIPLGRIQLDAEVLVNDTQSSPYTQLSGTPFDVDLDSFPTTDVVANKAYAKTGGMEIEPTTINDLRRAMKLQTFLEKNARGGTRYIENILVHFGIRSSDKRLQRPEYITGVKTPITISEVLNTAGVEPGTWGPVGSMAGHGVGVVGGRFGSFFCEEHGYIIGIMSVMPKTAYMQGIPKHFLKSDLYDYFWPDFANIGEQAVEVQELYAYTVAAKETWGYVPRYAEYKFENNRVAGDFRTSLNYWHEARIFDNEPALNQEFVECVPDKRIFSVVDPTVDSLYAHVYNQVTAVRPMPKYGTPM